MSRTSATAHDPLVEWRPEFPTVEATLHFISHSLGAMPRGVEEALRRYAQIWKARGIRAWEDEWFGLPVEVGNVIASLIGAEPGTVSMHPNVTLAQAVVLSGVDFRPPRNRLVCTAEDFPSVLHLYEGLERRGVEVVRVAARAGRRIDEQDVVSAIDKRTAVVAVSSVLFRTSQVLDLAPLVARAHAVGALTLIDAYQAVGTVPVDVRALGVDLLCGGSVKWLCGGPGAAFLYCRPEVASRLEPAVTGWLAHERPFDFDPGPMRRDLGPRRFWTGTPAIPALVAARVGFETVGRIGVPAIRAKSLRQTERMIGWADEMGMPVVSPREAERRGGTVVLDVPNAEAVCQALLAADVLLDHRPGVGLRLGPHFYTRDDEVDLVMKRIQEAAQRAG
ncbi:MAG TPA: aminotransferase class V-fold PLP-dependent enzyme [Candidatus Limnocylindria bacterium]|nr:aminotransferase class V-fold PLP-dependent enzyme [Candidatus Limnocylindria bacterium]